MSTAFTIFSCFALTLVVVLIDAACVVIAKRNTLKKIDRSRHSDDE